MKKYALLIIAAAMLTACGKVDTTSNTIDTPVVDTIQLTTDESATDVFTEPTTEASTKGDNTRTTAAHTTGTGGASGKRTTVPKSNGGRTNATPVRPANNNNSAPKATQAPATTPPPTQPPTAAPTTEPNNDIMMTERFGISEKGVNIYSNGKKIQHLDVNTEALMASEHRETLFQIVDFDFDNHVDLFVPEAVGTLNTTGKYFRFNSSTGLFEDWTELNNIQYSITTDPEKKELTLYLRNNAIDHETKVYEWKDHALSLKTRSIIYKSDDGQIYDESYEYTDGVEKMTKRVHIIVDENGTTIGQEEIPVSDTE